MSTPIIDSLTKTRSYSASPTENKGLGESLCESTLLPSLIKSATDIVLYPQISNSLELVDWATRFLVSQFKRHIDG